MSNYNLQTAGETRIVAEMKDDKQRRGTEGVLFGAYAPEIRYAALALDQRGLISYGNCSMTLADMTMRYKATLLEENSYFFVQKHRIVAGDALPQGYRATWENRHLLAVAKLADKITQKAQNWANVLLHSNGDRQHDEFIEVHIYGAFDKQAIEAVAIPSLSKKNKDHLAVLQIQDYAENYSIPCHTL